jgi:thiamine kinase-like enzyme
VPYVRSLHEALPPSGRSYDPVALSRDYLSAGSPPGWVVALADRLRWQPAILAPCHNDLNPWNVICRGEDDWLTLDWEWFGDNDPLFDLVTLHQGLGGDDDSLSPLVAAWAEATGDRPDTGRLDACLTGFWLREYAWAHAELVQGNRRPEIEAQLTMSEDRLRGFSSA